MICIVGDDRDLSARYMGWLAERRSLRVAMLAEDRFGIDWWFRMGPGGTGALVIDGEEIDLAEVDGAIVRLNPEPAIDPALAVSPEVEPVYALERRHGLHWLLNEAPFGVVNRPAGGRSNGSKPYQMSLLARAGFAVPAWIVTAEPRAARRFVDACSEGAVYKATSGLRSHVRRADEQLFDRLAAGTTPVVIQQYVPGADVRIHTIGRRSFGTEIVSSAIDYRFDHEAPTYRSVGVPPALVQRCGVVAREDGLELAGFDFRRDPDGRWWCLEMNPVPTFLPYEAATGHPIGDAILDHLLGCGPTMARSPLPLAFEPESPRPVPTAVPGRVTGAGRPA